uniref:Uncharacterized protein n=1 Tax=Rheinheimera sp. BAL341 TaxID=1708203 RepID=A0A486XGN8_9GAMM
MQPGRNLAGIGNISKKSEVGMFSPAAVRHHDVRFCCPYSGKAAPLNSKIRL